MAKMGESDLRALLQAERHNAMGTANASKLSSERITAMNYYNGEMSDMPAAEGRSQAVSSDVLDVVEGLMPSLMEIFASAEEVVRFEPVGFEDEQAAEQETDYVNHVFMQKNPGFLVLYSFIKDALLSKVGVVKVYWDESERESRETYHDQPDDVFAAIVADPDVEIVEHSEEIDEATGEKTHSLTVKTTVSDKQARVVPVPPEEFLISRKARSIRDSSYCAHRVFRTQDELLNQGFDAEDVKALPTSGVSQNQEEQERNTVEQWTTQGDTANEATRTIEVVEHYCRLDYEGDGVARIYRVTTAGSEGQILKRGGKLDVECVDEMPFAAMTPVIVTHRFWGRSIADLVIDLQRIKTALYRSLLDNAYLASNNRYIVAENGASERTLDDLLANRPGGIIRAKSADAVVPVPNNPIGGFVFPLIEYIDGNKEFRTGVSRQASGLDPNALQNSTATAVNASFTAAQAKMKLIARIFAETGIKDLFLLLHSTIRKNDRRVNTVKLRNNWVAVNPRDWRLRNDMTVNVGLGSGSKQERVQHLMMLLGLQKEAIAAPQLGLVKPENIYNTVKKVVELIDLKSVEPYFTDPRQQPPQQPQPDPKMLEMQMKAQLEQQKAERDAQLQVVISQRQAEQEAAQARADIEVERQKAAYEMQLKEREFQFNSQLKILEARLEAESKAREDQQAMAMKMWETSRGPALSDGAQMAAPVDHAPLLAGAMQALAASLAAAHAPKRTSIMRDENGRAIGAETVIGP